MKIGIVDSAFAHSKTKFSNDFCVPNTPFEWDRSCKSDWVVFTDYSIGQYNQEKFRKKKKIAWLIEPLELQSSNYSFVSKVSDEFEFIFSSHLDWIGSHNNAVFIPFGGTWIYKKDWDVYGKNKKISIIASDKNYAQGHKIRHALIGLLGNKLDIYGRKYNPIQYKLDGLKDYKFQLVIENIKEDGWFTEKLIDCFLTGTIPIYWGGDVSEYFNTDGMLIFNTEKEFSDLLLNLDSIKINQDVLINNFNEAKKYVLAENHIWRFFKENIG